MGKGHKSPVNENVDFVVMVYDNIIMLFTVLAPLFKEDKWRVIL